MNKILAEIDRNIMRKKIELMKTELHNMSKDADIMDIEIKSINKTYEKLLFKKEPVGCSSNAIKYLKLQR